MSLVCRAKVILLQPKKLRHQYAVARGMSSLVRIETEGGVKTLTMTSPKTANALSLEMLELLTDEMSRNDKDLRTIVIRQALFWCTLRHPQN